ncbi:MAG: glycosyltransferase family 4 protein [Candidatus Obscuribacterales bacterium]
MRICLISREYPPDTGFGGIATFTKHLAHGLRNLGHEVVVVALAKDRATVAEDHGIMVHRVEPYPFVSKLAALSMCIPYSKYVLFCCTALWDKFAQLHAIEPFDVVDTPELLAEGIIPAVTQVVPQVIRLYTPHSKFIAEKLHNVVPSFDHQFVAMLERIAMLQADVLTSPSNDLAQFVAGDLGLPVERIQIVRNPIDTSIFTPEGEQALSKSDKLRIVFVGRLEGRKGITYLVEAIPLVVAEYPNVEFVIIGDDTTTGEGMTSVLASLKKSLNASNCTKHVTFIDRISLDELPNYYRSADISVVPSVYDNSPYTCLEAMACGKPVIGTDAGGTKEYIEHGVSGLIIPACDTNALAQACIELLSNSAERKRLSNGARERAVRHFDRTEIARQTVACYDLAAKLFNERKASAAARSLYHHDFKRATADAATLIDSFDKAIYDLLFQRSYRFRIAHWWRILKARPKLFSAKLVTKISKGALRLIGTKEDRMPTFLKNLDTEIDTKDKERLGGKLAGKHE